jgi:hypothetical protein
MALAATAALLGATAAQAADWQFLGRQDNEVVFWVLPRVIHDTPTSRLIWVKATSSTPGYGLMYEQVNCQLRSHRTLQSSGYDSDGQEVGFRETRPTPWAYAIPDTVYEVLVNYACEH